MISSVYLIFRQSETNCKMSNFEPFMNVYDRIMGVLLRTSLEYECDNDNDNENKLNEKDRELIEVVAQCLRSRGHGHTEQTFILDVLAKVHSHVKDIAEEIEELSLSSLEKDFSHRPTLIFFCAFLRYMKRIDETIQPQDNNAFENLKKERRKIQVRFDELFPRPRLLSKW